MFPPLNYQDPLFPSYGSEPTANRLPLLVAFYDMQGIQRTYSKPRTCRGVATVFRVRESKWSCSVVAKMIWCLSPDVCVTSMLTRKKLLGLDARFMSNSMLWGCLGRPFARWRLQPWISADGCAKAGSMIYVFMISHSAWSTICVPEVNGCFLASELIRALTLHASVNPMEGVRVFCCI